MKLFLGVDGGQSSTAALIADETGRVLGAGTGGPCNHAAGGEGRAKFARAMAEALGSAGAAAGLLAGDLHFEAACLGFSGGFEDKDAYARQFIRSRLFKLTHDAEIALMGAAAGEPGIIVIAGTGSIAFGKNASGRTTRAGGWGYLFGDEGGAFDIAKQALRAALAMEESWGAPTALRDALLHATGAATANQLMHAWYNDFDRMKIARLAPLVDRAALAGDLVAGEILKASAEHLSGLVDHVYQQLFERREKAVICCIGGVFESAALVAETGKNIHRKTGNPVSPPQWPPAAGALLEAFRLAGNQSSLTALPHIKT